MIKYVVINMYETIYVEVQYKQVYLRPALSSDICLLNEFVYKVLVDLAT